MWCVANVAHVSRPKPDTKRIYRMRGENERVIETVARLSPTITCTKSSDTLQKFFMLTLTEKEECSSEAGATIAKTVEIKEILQKVSTSNRHFSRAWMGRMHTHTHSTHIAHAAGLTFPNDNQPILLYILNVYIYIPYRKLSGSSDHFVEIHSILRHTKTSI